MFNQSEKKLKTWATIQGMFFSVVAIVLGAVIYSAAAATDNNAVGLLLGVIVAVVVWFLSMLSVWTLYSFADLVEYTKANNEILARAHIDAHLDDKISVELEVVLIHKGWSPLYNVCLYCSIKRVAMARRRAFPRGGRWPRPRPRSDEGRPSGGCPFTDCRSGPCPHQSASGVADSFPRGGGSHSTKKQAALSDSLSSDFISLPSCRRPCTDRRS